MTTRAISAYNLARGILLNSKLTLADSGNQPLKLLDIVVSGMGMDPSAGLWLTPLHSIPAVPRVFPFDLIYLDKEYRVLDIAEMGPGIDFPAFHPEVASALVLPSDTLHRTKTAPGDHLIVCASNDLEAILAVSSLPAPDAAEPVQLLAPATPTRKPALPGTIELTPERPPSPAPPVTAFDQSVLTAVAKVAETRNAEPKPFAASVETPTPGPSMEVTEAVLDISRKVQPAVVEHRIDPEDLFSNWVSTAPPAAAAPHTFPPEPPKAPIPASSTEAAAPESPKQNGRKSKPAETRAASTDSAALKSKSKAPAPATDKTGSATKAKSDEPVRASSPVPPQTPAPQTPATTFTSSSFGIWQISAPTAVAPMSGAKSPQPPAKAPAESKPAPIAKPSAPDPTQASKAAKDNETENPPPQPPASQLDPVPQAEIAANSPKPALRNTSDVHRPGDFVASLQEKLQRVQQIRPPAQLESTPAPAPTPASRPASSVSGTVASPTEAPARDKKPAPPPALKSAVAPPSPAPAKPKPEAAPSGLRSRFRQWLHPTSSPSDRRRAARRYVPGVVAHYFTGGAPKPKNVADISMSGMYLLTDDRWMPGTMIQMTLQKPCASGEKKQSINVLSRIVRRGSDGVAIEFIMPEALPHISHDIQPSQATDKFALARFL